MHSVTIDAGVLAVPDDDRVQDGYEYVQTLLDWSQLLEQPWVSIYVSKNASEVLVEHEIYPLRNALRDLFKETNIIEFNVNDVASVADRLLRITPSFEEQFQINDVLIEELETEPDINSLTLHKKLTAELGRCLVICAILRHKCNPPIENHTIILKKCPGTDTVKLKTLIHDLECCRDDIQDLPKPPVLFKGLIPACHDFRGLIKSINEHKLWNNTKDHEFKSIALRIALYKSRMNRNLEPEWEKIVPIQFGRQFITLAERVCSTNNEDLVPKLIRSMVETLERLNSQDTHALRLNEGGGSPQRLRNSDSARAWRRDIDYEYHLHYWELSNGTIEFASMGPHNDFSIPE